MKNENIYHDNVVLYKFKKNKNVSVCKEMRLSFVPNIFKNMQTRFKILIDSNRSNYTKGKSLYS